MTMRAEDVPAGVKIILGKPYLPALPDDDTVDIRPPKKDEAGTRLCTVDVDWKLFDLLFEKVGIR